MAADRDRREGVETPPEGVLQIAVGEREGAVVVAFAGDIDLEDGDRVAAALADAIAIGPAVVADLRDVTCLGSTGARLLLQAHQAAAAQGSACR